MKQRVKTELAIKSAGILTISGDSLNDSVTLTDSSSVLAELDQLLQAAAFLAADV